MIFYIQNKDIEEYTTLIPPSIQKMIQGNNTL